MGRVKQGTSTLTSLLLTTWIHWCSTATYPLHDLVVPHPPSTSPSLRSSVSSLSFSRCPAPSLYLSLPPSASLSLTHHTNRGSPALTALSTFISTPPSAAVIIARQVLLYDSRGGPRGTRAKRRARLTPWREAGREGEGKERNSKRKGDKGRNHALHSSE